MNPTSQETAMCVVGGLNARATVSCIVFIAILLAGLSDVSAQETLSPKFVMAWGKKGDRPGEFYSPVGIAIDKHDEVFVTDVNNARLQRFSSDGKYLGGFNLPHDQPNRISNQCGGIAVDDQGLIYLSFMEQHKIGVYTKAGRLMHEWGKQGKGDGEFNRPGGLVLTPTGFLYVTDQANHRIQKFTTAGEFVSKWGEYGSQPGRFDGIEKSGNRFGGPNFLARDSRGRLYSTEGIRGRVQQFTPDGTPLLAWGDKGEQPGGFGALETSYAKSTFGPIGICTDKYDRVLVSSLNDRVQFFTPEGKYLFGLGGSGNEPGQLARPHGMAFDSQGFLYVADSGNERIQKFAVPYP